MATSAQNKATAKYNKAKYDDIKLHIPSGTKSALQNYLFAERSNISLNAYIIGLIEADINQKLTDL